MMHARRWKLSSAQRADMWSRWKAGQSLNAIGRALGKDQHEVCGSNPHGPTIFFQYFREFSSESDRHFTCNSSPVIGLIRRATGILCLDRRLLALSYIRKTT
jgi:hypothetical protein